MSDVFAYFTIERLHSVPGELDNKEDGGHIGVPDKSISSCSFAILCSSVICLSAGKAKNA